MIPCSEIRKRTKVIDIIEYTLKQKWADMQADVCTRTQRDTLLSSLELLCACTHCVYTLTWILTVNFTRTETHLLTATYVFTTVGQWSCYDEECFDLKQKRSSGHAGILWVFFAGSSMYMIQLSVV